MFNLKLGLEDYNNLTSFFWVSGQNLAMSFC